MLLSFSVLVAASVVKNSYNSCDVQAADGGTNIFFIIIHIKFSAGQMKVD